MRTGLFWDETDGAYWCFDIAENGNAVAFRADRRADNPAFCAPWRQVEPDARVLHPLPDNSLSFGMYTIQNGRLWHGVTTPLQSFTYPRASYCLGVSATGALRWQQAPPSAAPQNLQYPERRPLPDTTLPLSPEAQQQRWQSARTNPDTFAIHIADTTYSELQETAETLVLPANRYDTAEDWLDAMESAFMNPEDPAYAHLNTAASTTVDCPKLAARQAGSGLLYMLKKWVLVDALTRVCNRVRELFGYAPVDYGAPLRRELDSVRQGMQPDASHSPPQVTDHRSLLHRRASLAQQNYSNWFNHRIGGRGEETWCTRLFRHTESGQRFARDFVDNFPIGVDIVTETAYINKFLRKWRRNWHRHSFTAFLLDALRTIQGSPWQDCPVNTDNLYRRYTVFGHIDSYGVVDDAMEDIDDASESAQTSWSPVEAF